MAIVITIDHTAYSPHMPLISDVFAKNLPVKNASVSIILIMNNIFIRVNSLPNPGKLNTCRLSC